MKKKGDLNRKTVSKIYTLLTKSGPLHVREIIRRTGLGRKAAPRALRTLEEKGVLSSFTQGRRKYYFVKEGLSISESRFMLKRLGWGSLEIEGKCAEAIGKISEEMRVAASIFKNLTAYMKASAKITKEAGRLINVASKAADHLKAFFTKHEGDIIFLREELLRSGVDLFEADLEAAFKIINWFMKHKEGYLFLRKRGLQPLTALEWAGEGSFLRESMRMREIPAAEYAFNRLKRRFNLHHTPLTLKLTPSPPLHNPET